MIDQIDEWETRLRTEFPKMFPGGDIGVWVGPGWQTIVAILCATIQRHIDTAESRLQWLVDRGQLPEDYEPIEQVTVSQIKEKFGELRFYYDGGDDHINGLVIMAEEWASRTCEECGKPGTARRDGWIKTLCDEHAAERIRLREARMAALEQVGSNNV